MNTQQEIKELRDKINESLNKLNELEANYKREKNTVEVGSIFKKTFRDGSFIIGVVLEKDDRYIYYYGFNELGEFSSNEETLIDGHLTQSIVEATKKEWETALTKYCDKLFEGVEKVDRTGLY